MKKRELMILVVGVLLAFNSGAQASVTIVGWGMNGDGQATAPSGNDYTAIAGGYYHSLALKTDGSIVAWGDDYYGQGTALSGNDYTAIAGGAFHSLALEAAQIVPEASSVIVWSMLTFLGMSYFRRRNGH